MKTLLKVLGFFIIMFLHVFGIITLFATIGWNIANHDKLGTVITVLLTSFVVTWTIFLNIAYIANTFYSKPIRVKVKEKEDYYGI